MSNEEIFEILGRKKITKADAALVGQHLTSLAGAKLALAVMAVFKEKTKLGSNLLDCMSSQPEAFSHASKRLIIRSALRSKSVDTRVIATAQIGSVEFDDTVEILSDLVSNGSPRVAQAAFFTAVHLRADNPDRITAGDLSELSDIAERRGIEYEDGTWDLCESLVIEGAFVEENAARVREAIHH